jgi:hypothetical protein
MVTVQVVWKKSGTPAPSQKVSCCFGRRWSDNKTSEVITNEQGKAYFEVGQKSGEVYVNGLTMYKGIIAGNIIVYLDN